MKLTMKLAAIAAVALLTTNAAFAQDDEGTLQTIPNEIKYKDDKPNAKGTGEIGVVETRALLSRDGSATLEITTGNLDTGEPSTTANITKVQVKHGLMARTITSRRNRVSRHTLTAGEWISPGGKRLSLVDERFD